jgi:glutathione S-transferase
MLRLVTIPISHYCEKARWALERAGIPYREERHVQAIHRIAARRAGGGATVPVLVTPEGALGESEKILVWIDERTPPEHRLFPSEPGERAEVERLCRRLDERLGPTGRRLMYIHMLPQRELMLRFNNQGVPPWEDRALRLGWPLAVRWARRERGIRPGVEAEDEAAVWREPDLVAELLADRRERVRALAAEHVSAPEPITFPTTDGDVAHGFFYPPRNPDFAPLPGEKPPLMVIAHGGPTGARSARVRRFRVTRDHHASCCKNVERRTLNLEP